MSGDDLEKITETVSEQEQEYAQNALNEFKKKNYGGALQFINKLDHRNSDLKVVHNKSLVEYYKSDFRKTEAFQKVLTYLSNHFRLRIENLDAVDHCILHFNQAILYYHQRQYTAAIQIMDRVYKFIEPMDDALAKQLSLFVIELQLSVREPEKALSFISYAENQILNGTPNIKLLDKNVKEKKAQLPIDEEYRKKLIKYKARCYLMNHSLDAASKEIKLLAKEKANANAMFMSANLEYLKGNLDEAQKILNSIPNDCLVYNECGESSSIMFNNNLGVIHHALGKPHLACHFFQTAIKQDMATTNYTKKDLSEKPLHTLGGSKYHELMYNLGIALLYAKRPTQAFEALIIAVRRYHRNSRLWMRLAECCIMVNKESNESDFRVKGQNIVVGVCGSRDKRKVIINTNLTKDKKYSSESMTYAVPTPSLEFAMLCLRNALLLLPSDPSDTTPSADPILTFVMPGLHSPVPPPSPGPAPSSPLSSEGIANLKNSILVASAYVALCLGDYIIALEHAEDLLKQPRISEVHKLLGHLYCAESLVLLDKITQALEHLHPEVIKDISFGLPPADNDQVDIKTAPRTKWFPSDIATAQTTMQYNVAVVKAIKGQLNEAKAIVKEIGGFLSTSKGLKAPSHIILFYLYLELRLGRTESAKALVKSYLT